MTEERAKTPKVKVNNTERVEAFRSDGGRIVHSIVGRKRPMTFAVIKKGRRLFVATSLCHPNDQFCKKMGTKTALDNYEAGHFVVLPAEGDFNETVWNLRWLNS